MLNLRFLLAVLLLATTAVFLQAHGRVEHIPNRLPLASFPKQLNGWNGTDVSIDQDVLTFSGQGTFCCECTVPKRTTSPMSTFSLLTFRRKGLAIRFTRPRIACPERDGVLWSPAASMSRSRDMSRSPRTAMSSPRDRTSN